MKKRAFILIFILFLFCFLYCENPSVGIVTFIKGEGRVLVHRGDNILKLKVDDLIYKDDIVETKKRSRIRIVFYDPSISACITIKSNKSKKISELFTKKNLNLSKISTEIAKSFIETQQYKNTIGGIGSSLPTNSIAPFEEEKDSTLKLAKLKKKMESIKKSPIEFDSVKRNIKPYSNGISMQSKKIKSKFNLLYPVGKLLNPPDKILCFVNETSDFNFKIEYNSKIVFSKVTKLKSGLNCFNIPKIYDVGKFVINVNGIKHNFVVSDIKTRNKVKSQISYNKSNMDIDGDPTFHLLNSMLLNKNQYYFSAFINLKKYLNSQKSKLFRKKLYEPILNKLEYSSLSEIEIESVFHQFNK